MMNKHILIMSAAVAAISLSGCSNSSNEPAPVQNEASASVSQPVEEAPPAPEPSPVPSPPAAPVTLNSAEEVPPEEARAADEQMMEDADATGMTARASRNEETPEAAPVEQK